MIKRTAIAAFLLCTLVACGNKGPLVLAGPAPAAQPVVAPAAEADADADADVDVDIEADAPATEPAAEPAADDGTPVRR